MPRMSPCLPLESRLPRWISRELRREHLESHAPVEPGVFRFVDFAHAPVGDEAQDSKALAEDLAGSKHPFAPARGGSAQERCRLGFERFVAFGAGISSAGGVVFAIPSLVRFFVTLAM